VLVVALCFMEIWKRRQAELQYEWDVADFEADEVNSVLLFSLLIHEGSIYAMPGKRDPNSNPNPNPNSDPCY